MQPKKMLTVGKRVLVFHGKAHHTSGGLTKKDLMKNKHGEIVSRKKHFQAKKDNHLQKAGYFTVKGKFGYVKRDLTKKRKSKRR